MSRENVEKKVINKIKLNQVAIKWVYVLSVLTEESPHHNCYPCTAYNSDVTVKSQNHPTRSL